MGRRLLALALIGSLVVLLVAPSASVYACGPYFSEAVFTYTLHPDFPLTNFAAGNLGLLQPTYAPSYLIVAYRYLNGTPLSDAEQKSVQQLWRARLSESNYVAANETDPAKVWLETRSKYSTEKGPETIDVYREIPKKNPNDYEPSFVNCLPDAFTNASNTLTQRAQHFGAPSEALKIWIETQDAVFAQCSTPAENAKPAPPPALPSNTPALLQQDRAYQLASLDFYSLDFIAAAKAFAAIADDQNSPWRNTAALLVARSMIRKATLIDTSEAQSADLRAAGAALQRIVAGAQYAEVHASAKRLQNFVAFRLDPAKRAQQLATELSGAAPVENLGGAIDDYTLLDAKYTQLAADAKPAPGSAEDLMDWLTTFSTTPTTADVSNHAIARWNASHSMPWLVAALITAPANSPSTATLIDAAGKIDASNPAFVTLAFHRDRLLVASGKRDEARTNLDALLASTTAPLSASSRNMFLALRMQLATNLDDWLKFAVRTPALTITTDSVEAWAPASEFATGATPSTPGEWDKPQPSVPLFDTDSALALTTKFPLATLASASKSSALPPSLRKQLTQAAWTRAVILKNRAVALDLSPAMKAAYPERASEIDAYATAKTDDEQNFAGAIAILKTPGWQPLIQSGTARDVDSVTEMSNYRQNWWCGWKHPAGAKDSDYDGNDYTSSTKISGPLETLHSGRASAPSPAFFDDATRAQAEKEWTALAATGSAIQALGTAVQTFANSHVEDPRVPEALHLVVQVSRYGCYGAPNASYSKAAHDLLHSRYADSPWTRKTPYWFK